MARRRPCSYWGPPWSLTLALLAWGARGEYTIVDQAYFYVNQSLTGAGLGSAVAMYQHYPSNVSYIAVGAAGYTNGQAINQGIVYIISNSTAIDLRGAAIPVANVTYGMPGFDPLYSPAGSEFGWSIASIPSIIGAPHYDLAVGAPREGSTGVVYITTLSHDLSTVEAWSRIDGEALKCDLDSQVRCCRGGESFGASKEGIYQVALSRKESPKRVSL
jgi:hypothetical protein